MVSSPAGGQFQPAGQAEKIRLRFWPIVAIFGLLLPSFLLGGIGSKLVERWFSMRQLTAMPWIEHYAGHAGMLVGGLLVIGVLGKGRFRDYGLKLPAGRTYVTAAVVWGAAFGVIMFVIDYSKELMTHAAPSLPLTSTNITGWLTFEGLWAGTVEEIVFRGLLMTFLMSRISGRVRIGKYDLHVAGVVIALLFAVAHLPSFWTRPFLLAAGQQVYAFVLAILYANWYEKSGSVLAPIIGHNVSNFLEYVLAFAIAWAWR